MVKHLTTALPAGIGFGAVGTPGEIATADENSPDIVLVHVSSLGEEAVAVVTQVRAACTGAIIGVASDEPGLAELRRLAALDVRAYFNSYMADVHYLHLLATLREGECWFAPSLLRAMLDTTRESPDSPKPGLALDGLTVREREIARSVALGMNNKEIGRRFGITERTVKAHLTRIYGKLQVSDRLVLAVRLNATGGSR